MVLKLSLQTLARRGVVCSKPPMRSCSWPTLMRSPGVPLYAKGAMRPAAGVPARNSGRPAAPTAEQSEDGIKGAPSREETTRRALTLQPSGAGAPGAVHSMETSLAWSGLLDRWVDKRYHG